MVSTISSSPDTAAVPASLIETIRVDAGGAMPLLDGHLARLRHSCQALGFAWPGLATVRDGLKRQAGELSSEQSWRLRLLLDPAGDMTLEATPLEPAAQALNVRVTGPRPDIDMRWLLHKTTHRPWYREAARWLAAHPDVFDVLYWNADGWMCEGSRSNLYMRTVDGGWLTPPLESGALPGVQRQTLLRRGLVEEAPIHRDDFLRAPAVRISNALRGWCDAAIVNG